MKTIRSLRGVGGDSKADAPAVSACRAAETEKVNLRAKVKEPLHHSASADTFALSATLLKTTTSAEKERVAVHLRARVVETLLTKAATL